MARFHSLKIADVRRETPDAVSIAFDVPEDAKDAFAFVPGQYLTLRTDVGGEPVQRTYSICSGLDEGELRVAIKRVEDGVFSNYANDNLEAGMEVDVMGPQGRFTAQPTAGARNHYVAFTAGSGVTPIFSIVKTILTREPNSTFTMFYGNRDRASVIFREQLEDLKDRFLERFTLIHILSREGQDVDLLHGRLDAERIEKFAETGLFDVDSVANFFLCGPGDMIETSRASLEKLGVPAERIRFELFTPAEGSPPPKPKSQKAREAAEKGVAIETVLDGASRGFVMGAQDDNVVDAAHRHGIELPFSCKGGMCCTCRCRLKEGEVEMAANYSLEPWELEAGFVLACQSRPLTDKVVLDFDEV
ncbi:1,2-phenylacetyl-CoA epoxidase subunit PaaE [Nitratireductor sp. XY-223]|uniref:1,2-phenylacetyl-CoA epoxidase subunit PaaE n=1 Tax=Nitratireductor sp. XY-223 TaxID=2561926 RepID=UPI0010AA8D1B|nr:1,2-phenylacetyl-CoA epoxidase subunit PaaE [Nitratireductor sp. XY-223]